MNLSEKSKQHIDSCRFCWMCHHICPIGNATGHERSTARARALGISLVNRGAMELEDIMDNIYECATCGGCVSVCTTGWDPVMFTKEVRLQAALEGKLPAYIRTLVEKAIATGSAYGEIPLGKELSEAISSHSDKTKTLLFLGTDARAKAQEDAVRAIRVLEKAGVEFTVLAGEIPSGAQLDFLIGKANETLVQMKAAAKLFDSYETVVFYDPQDAVTAKQTYKEYGVKTASALETYTSFVAGLLGKGALKLKNSGKAVVFQDPFQLARNLEETSPAREIIRQAAKLDEMLLHGKETVWAGNLLMGEYMPDVMRLVAARRLENARSIGAKAIVTASVSENAALKKAAAEDIEILSLEELILGK